MKLNLDCRDATRLVLEAEERPLTLVERLSLRMHLAICAACPRFVRQVRLMRSAMGRWRAYRDGSGSDDGND